MVSKYIVQINCKGNWRQYQALSDTKAHGKHIRYIQFHFMQEEQLFSQYSKRSRRMIGIFLLINLSSRAW